MSIKLTTVVVVVADLGLLIPAPRLVTPKYISLVQNHIEGSKVTFYTNEWD